MSQPAPVVVVAGALVDDGRILLAHRSPARRWYPDVWDLPGGHVEPGESGVQALVRELDEELGVTVVDGSCVPVSTLTLTAGDGVGDLRLSVWSVRRWSGTPVNRCLEEHDQLGWFRAADLARLVLAHDDYPALLGGLLRGS